MATLPCSPSWSTTHCATSAPPALFSAPTQTWPTSSTTSELKVTTGTPEFTAFSTAGIIILASVGLMIIASTPCAIKVSTCDVWVSGLPSPSLMMSSNWGYSCTRYSIASFIMAIHSLERSWNVTPTVKVLPSAPPCCSWFSAVSLLWEGSVACSLPHAHRETTSNNATTTNNTFFTFIFFLLCFFILISFTID